MMDAFISLVRRAAHDLLLALHDTRAIDGIIAALSDSDLDVLELAIDLATKVPDQRAIPALVANLNNHRVAGRVAVALLAIGGSGAREALAANIGSSGSYAPRALALMGDDRGISWCLEDVRRTKNQYSAQALGRAYRSPKLTHLQKTQILREGSLAVRRNYEVREMELNTDTRRMEWVSDPKTELTNLERYLIGSLLPGENTDELSDCEVSND